MRFVSRCAALLALAVACPALAQTAPAARGVWGLGASVGWYTGDFEGTAGAAVHLSHVGPSGSGFAADGWHVSGATGLDVGYYAAARKGPARPFAHLGGSLAVGDDASAAGFQAGAGLIFGPRPGVGARAGLRLRWLQGESIRTFEVGVHRSW